MASGFFALFDDIALLMDDVASMSKVATKKTAGILADDLAVNADKASGFVSSRELPVLWKITKGSFLNKIIILPIAFLLSAYFPPAIISILLIGGLYLGFEGAEKIYEWIFHRDHQKKKGSIKEMTRAQALEYEKEKIKAAITVDFILSIEIIIIALGTVVNEPMQIQVAVVSVVALLATVGVYGIVALLVRMDDLGFRLIAIDDNTTGFEDWLGNALVSTLPYLIRGLAILGTLAMILVAGGIFVHNVHFIHDLVHGIPSLLGEFIVGLAVGFITLLVVIPLKKIFIKEDKINPSHTSDHLNS